MSVGSLATSTIHFIRTLVFLPIRISSIDGSFCCGLIGIASDSTRFTTTVLCNQLSSNRLQAQGETIEVSEGRFRLIVFISKKIKVAQIDRPDLYLD